MKKLLVTGASGTIGKQVIKYLLSEGKYDITAIDVKTKRNYKVLKKYRKRIQIKFADITDKNVIDSLIKDNEVVIHLASSLPPISNLDEDIMNNNDYLGTKNIVDSIKKYNPKCYLLFASTTSVYGPRENYDEISIKDKTNIEKRDYYSKYKLKSEKYIIKTIKNYTIYRIPYVLGDLKKDNIIFNVSLNSEIETILSENAAYALIASIDNKNTLNRKVMNLTGGKDYRISYKDYLLKVLDCYGLSLKIWHNLIFIEKNFYNGYFMEEGPNDLLNYRTKNINVYLNSLEDYKTDIKRLIPRLLAKPIKLIIKIKR